MSAIFINEIHARSKGPVFERLYKLAIKRDVFVIEMDIEQRGNWLDAQLEGKRVDAIIINRKLSDRQKTFVLAHELGHCVLHRYTFDQERYDNDPEYNSELERQADDFAYRLIGLIQRKLWMKLSA
jgi:Zn-dependent peptidase ImmA (M78 family)